ncbi:MAG TPA: Nramp family divalent metal transporter [Acetobacteraceae bacterium]|nr:Nramp family divalent metal transporter [Acetobacteraceae bacterium]
MSPSEQLVDDPEFPVEDGPDPVLGPSKPRLLGVLGPGLITGASDDDPSGIATYSQAGAQLGFGCLWLMLFSYPLMAATQEISARIGRTTGRGLAGNMRRHYPAWVGTSCILLLLIANVINLSADLGAMGDVGAAIIGGPRAAYVVAFGTFCMLMQVLVQYARYVAILKWLSLVLFAYFGTLLMVRIPWGDVAWGLFVPSFTANENFVAVTVAILGTTISPYLFFWQSSQEAEDQRERPLRDPLVRAPEQAPKAFARIRLDTYIGMALSNLVALAIIITAAATLHASGTTHIDTAQQAAEALKPIAGELAFLIFAAGIVGTGLLAVPVLAGSAAYAIGEALRWPVGLARKPKEARAFYITLAAATLIGTAIIFLPIDPIRALYWSAIINGVMAAPIIAMIMVMASSRRIMGQFTLPFPLKLLGWVSVVVMGFCVIGLFVTI